MTLDTIIHASSDQVSCDLGGEVAVLNLKTGTYYGLNPVGARIWSLIATPSSVTVVRDSIVAEYEVDQAECERDLFRIFEELVAAGVIEIRAPQTP
jgi:hypothetical protein